MRANNLIWIGLLILSGLVSATDGKPVKPDKYQIRLDFITQFAGEPKSSIPYLRNYDFEPLGKNALLLKYSGNKAYLLLLNNGCNSLTSANAISINNHGSTINAKFDSVRVISRNNNIREKCQINQIQEVDVKAMKAEEAAIRESNKNA